MALPYDIALEAVRNAVKSQAKDVSDVIVEAIAREAATAIRHRLGKQAEKVARLADAIETIGKEE